jgi:flagellar hook-associated protein 3 FlgL
MPLITENMIFTSLRNSVAQTAFRLQQAQVHASAGKRVMSASDDPVAAIQISAQTAGLQSLEGMGNAAQFAEIQESAAGQSIAAAQTLVARAKEFAIQAATGSVNQSDRENIASQVGQLRESLLALANTQVSGVYIFAGFATAAAPFATDGTYSGDSGVRIVEAAPEQMVAVNIPGSQVFNVDGGQNIIGVLDNLQQALLANDVASVQADMDGLDRSTTQLSQAQATVGASLTALQGATFRRQQLGLLLAGQRSALGDLDQAVGITDLVQAQSAYQAAVAQASRMLDVLSRGILGG